MVIRAPTQQVGPKKRTNRQRKLISTMPPKSNFNLFLVSALISLNGLWSIVVYMVLSLPPRRLQQFEE